MVVVQLFFGERQDQQQKTFSQWLVDIFYEKYKEDEVYIPLPLCIRIEHTQHKHEHNLYDRNKADYINKVYIFLVFTRAINQIYIQK